VHVFITNRLPGGSLKIGQEIACGNFLGAGAALQAWTLAFNPA
jgi:hypothetical protein